MDKDLLHHLNKSQALRLIDIMNANTDDQKELFSMITEETNMDLLADVNLYAMGLKNSSTYATILLSTIKRVGISPSEFCALTDLVVIRKNYSRIFQFLSTSKKASLVHSMDPWTTTKPQTMDPCTTPPISLSADTVP